MMAESGEWNRSCEGSKVESGGGGGGGIAFRGDGEVGGSFVIVNGDSADHSDRSDLDPATKSENGEPLESEKNESLVVVGSNGDEVKGQQNVVSSGSDAKVGQEEADTLVAGPEKEPKAEEIDKEEILVVDVEEEEEPDVKIESKEEEVVEEAEAVLPLEELEMVAEVVEVVNGESESKGELGSEIGNEDVKEQETGESVSAPWVQEEQEPVPTAAEAGDKGDGGVINVAVAGEINIADEVESAVEAEAKGVGRIEEAMVGEPVPMAAEASDKGDGGVINVAVAGETNIAAEVESAVEAEAKGVGCIEVEETENATELESDVQEEQKEEPTNEAEVTGELAELGSAVGVELEQQPSTAAEKMDKAQVGEPMERKVEVEGNGNPAEEERAVEVEPEWESETAFDTDENSRAQERKEHADGVAENTAYGHLSLENRAAGIPTVAGDAPMDEPSDQPENGSADSTVDVRADTLEDELNGEARNIALENTQSTALCHVAKKELVEEFSRSTDREHVELEVSNGDTILSEPKTDVSDEDVEPCSSDPVSGVDLEPEDRDTEVELKDSVEDVETNKDVTVDRMKVESESGNKYAESNECVDSSIEGDQSTKKDDDEEATHEQVHATETIQAPQGTHVVKQPCPLMVKVPRFIDDELQKQIQEAQDVLEEKTKSRDELGVKIRMKEKEVYERSLDYKAELAKERAARAIYNAKRKEVDRVKEKIDWINNANTISDIDEKIRSMVHRQQHETISLKQEKQYIHDINQMKRLREQLSSKNASQEEIDEALKQRDEIEASFNNLKKGLDSKRAACSSAENSTKAAWTIYKDEENSLKKLKEERDAADAVRQEAYYKLRKLRNESAEKARFFKMYKADQLAVTNYRFSGDSQGLRSHCNRQVEKMMDLWNNNAEFREQYVKFNMYSTLWRLRTSDGRGLGPGEESPILRSHVDKSSNIVSAPSSNIQSSTPVLGSEVRQGNLTESSTTKQVASTNQLAKLCSTTKSAPAGGSMPTIPNNAESKEEDKENNKVKKEEEEMARKAEELARKEEELRKAKAAKEEELRKEKYAAQLKEQLRLEQKVKAREAEERKRRKAEKAQAKAEYRAQKEVELKEKKKAKKENKKSGIMDMPNGGIEGASAPKTSLPATSQVPETSSSAVTRKRSARPASSMRHYNKGEAPLPLPLRNRSKTKMIRWMWALLVILLVLLLFVAGNYISFSMFGMPDFGF